MLGEVLPFPNRDGWEMKFESFGKRQNYYRSISCSIPTQLPGAACILDRATSTLQIQRVGRVVSFSKPRKKTSEN
nr:hypothetical protein Q903MT_gene2188 [Picea sitchensis]